MADAAATKDAKAGGGAAQDPLKLAGGILLVVVSVGLMVHKMPRTAYVEVHEDKPRVRPQQQAEASAAAPAARPSATKPAPGKAQANAAPAKPAAPAAPEKIDLGEACSAEAGLLCYHVPQERLARCLTPFDDALRRGCRDALIGLGVKFDD